MSVAISTAKVRSMVRVWHSSTNKGAIQRLHAVTVQAAGLRHKLWSAGEVAARFPAVRLPSGASALWQPDSGVLDATAAAQLLAALAARVGADVRAGSRLVGWRDAGASPEAAV